MWAKCIVYITFLLLGLGSNLPWNVFITATAYFGYRLKNTTYEANFLSWFSVIFNLTSLATLVLRTAILRQQKERKATEAVFLGLCVITGIIALHCFLTTQPQVHGKEFFYATNISIMIISISTVYLNDGILRILANFPPLYTQGMVVGQALAGIGVSIFNFVILYANLKNQNVIGKESRVQNENADALVYFTLVLFTLIFCTLAFVSLTRMDLFHMYYGNSSEKAKLKEEESTQSAILEHTDAQKSLLDKNEPDPEKTEFIERQLVAYKLRYHLVTSVVIFLITLAVFPGITSSIRSVHDDPGRFLTAYFVPLSFILFNFGDFCGRIVAPWTKIGRAKHLMYTSFGRLVFLPLFMGCNIQDAQAHKLTHVIFPSDTVVILFIFFLAFTNGWLCTLALMDYPEQLNTDKEKEVGGTLMYFFLSSGLCGGSLLSFILQALLVSSGNHHKFGRLGYSVNE
uniref:Equilibrative Nucleoside Transporter (ENT) Family putative n=1 Tax=Albugo laibachii Nc14 TaxID=890382 RepID=F0VYV5_9STRA|nr:Equilibrative Nucleoside Transporter (ENT) Family putative [Albugo laibachii Nc14]|eukprot:CCA13970.1 Equilibrative Nucleoside Transporter (ENT) Family putative [Albugo laibachii Nc14]